MLSVPPLHPPFYSSRKPAALPTVTETQRENNAAAFMHKRRRADFRYHNYVRVLCVFVRRTAGEHNKTQRSTPPQRKIQLTFWRTRWESRWRCLDSLSAEMSIATSVHWRCERAVDSLLPRVFRVHPVCVCVCYVIFSLVYRVGVSQRGCSTCSPTNKGKKKKKAAWMFFLSFNSFWRPVQVGCLKIQHIWYNAGVSSPAPWGSGNCSAFQGIFKLLYCKSCKSKVRRIK